MIARRILCFTIYILLSIIISIQVSSECPNACNGHGRCGQYDMCACYRNWMANDCSQRICPFEKGYVDTPKGNIDGSSGYLSGPDKVVAVNDFMYPHGTSELYPNIVDSAGNIISNSAHEYRECSNAGYCDRQTGLCECFTGFEGSACQRMACPIGGVDGQVCSGHGVCRSADELANLDHGNIYKLWDQKMSTSCECDAGYFGPTCEQRRCKSGFDPIYSSERSRRYANWSIVIYTNEPGVEIKGNYSIVFYDEFGETWLTKPLPYGASCGVVVDALESLPNNVISKDSIHCLKWSDYHNIPAGQLGNDEPIDFGASNPYYGVKYTISFPDNPGPLRKLDVDIYLDGTRATLEAQSSTASLGYFVYANGFQGEKIEYFDHFCTGVEASLAEKRDVSSLDGYTYLTSLSPVEMRLLAQCLSDADGNSDTSSASGRIYGANYTWDYGSLQNPHLVRLVELPDSMGSNILTDLCPGKMNSERGSGSFCSYPGNGLPPGFVAPLIYDPKDKLFKIFTKVGKDYSANTKFAIYATSGTAQAVSLSTAIITDPARPYSTTVYSSPSSMLYESQGFDGDMACETSSVNTFGAIDCIEKGNLMFFLDPNMTLQSFDKSPSYLNLYTVQRVWERPKEKGYDHLSALPRREILLDLPITSSWSYDDGDRTRAYIFKPSTDDSFSYVTECSNRGLCDYNLGVCECFNGFVLDNCSLQETLTT